MIKSFPGKKTFEVMGWTGNSLTWTRLKNATDEKQFIGCGHLLPHNLKDALLKL
jgi:hypothetical protein